jgi:HSP20 family molecular chaperone IbpA
MVRATLDRQYRDAVMQSIGLLAARTLGRLPIYVAELAEAVLVRVVLGGILPDQLEVTLDRENLTIRVDLKSQTVALPAAVQAAGAYAHYRDGVLSLILPKANQQKLGSVTDTVTAQSEQSFPASDAPT